MAISKPEYAPDSADGSPSPPPRTDAPMARLCRKIAPNATSGADKAIKITHGEIELDCPCSRRSAHVARIVWRLASGALPDPRRQTTDDMARSRAGARSPARGGPRLSGPQRTARGPASLRSACQSSLPEAQRRKPKLPYRMEGVSPNRKEASQSQAEQNWPPPRRTRSTPPAVEVHSHTLPCIS